MKAQQAEGAPQGQPQPQAKLRQPLQPIQHTFSSPPSQSQHLPKYQTAKSGPMLPQRKLLLNKKMFPRPTSTSGGPPGSPQRFEKQQQQQQQQPIIKKLGPPLPPFRGTKLQRPQPQPFPHPVAKQYPPSPQKPQPPHSQDTQQEVPRPFPRPKAAPGTAYLGFRGQALTHSLQPPQPPPKQQPQPQPQPPSGSPALPNRKKQDGLAVSPTQSPPIQNDKSQSPVGRSRENSLSPLGQGEKQSVPPAPPPQSMKPQNLVAAAAASTAETASTAMAAAATTAESQLEKEETKVEPTKEKRKTQRVIPDVPDKRILDAINTESLQQLLERVSKTNDVKNIHNKKRICIFIRFYSHSKRL